MMTGELFITFSDNSTEHYGNVEKAEILKEIPFIKIVLVDRVVFRRIDCIKKVEVHV